MLVVLKFLEIEFHQFGGGISTPSPPPCKGSAWNTEPALTVIGRKITIIGRKRQYVSYCLFRFGLKYIILIRHVILGGYTCCSIQSYSSKTLPFHFFPIIRAGEGREMSFLFCANVVSIASFIIKQKDPCP